jgi:hypothetical protein
MLLEDYFNLDLLLYLRDYFIHIASHEKDEREENGIIGFLRKENQRSWRNFLSTHQSSPSANISKKSFHLESSFA